MVTFTEHHALDVVKIHPSGAVEWKCPDCDYHFIMQAKPFRKVVLNEGGGLEVDVGHSGSTVDWLRVGPVEVLRQENDPAKQDFLKELLGDSGSSN